MTQHKSSEAGIRSDMFIPATMEREVAKGIVFRPIRSWHSDTYAGEGLYKVDGDGSGCLHNVNGADWAPKPYSVTHRLYWNRKNPAKTISVFLSYPDGLGVCSEYFWEALPIGKEGNEARFSTEQEMERAVIRELRSKRFQP